LTIQFVADDNDDITFEVKGKISLMLTRKGIVYRGALIKDGGEVRDKMLHFLELADDQIEAEMHQKATLTEPSAQERLDSIAKNKGVYGEIQASLDGQDDGKWFGMAEADVADWVKEADAFTKMMDGEKLKADDGVLWYRFVIETQDEADKRVTH